MYIISSLLCVFVLFLPSAILWRIRGNVNIGVRGACLIVAFGLLVFAIELLLAEYIEGADSLNVWRPIISYIVLSLPLAMVSYGVIVIGRACAKRIHEFPNF